MGVAMLSTAAKDSPTVDEPAHIASGILNVRDRDLRWNAEHPPLVKLLAGLSTLGEDITIPKGTGAYRDGNEYAMGRALLYETGNDPHRILWRARLPMIGLSLVFGLVVFGFARELFGTAGGLVALAFYALCPTVLAHGRLVHTDVVLAGFLLTTAWFLFRSERRGFGWVVLAGLVCGFALSTKFTALFALPPVALVAFWIGFRRPAPDRGRRLIAAVGYAAAVVVLAFGVLWTVYLAASPSLRFQTRFYDPWASRAGGVYARVIDRLPVPEAYRVGLRFATAFDQSEERRAFLFGDLYTGGRWTFYPAVLVAKSPLASIAAWAAGLVILTRRRRADALRALLPIPATIFGLAMLSSTNIGIRHVVAVPIFGAVAAGSMTMIRRGHPAAVGLIVLVGISVWSRAYPSPIPYVNEAFGNPADAHEILTDANVDWGQDLGRLADYVRDNRDAEPDWIMYYGTADPAAYGIRAQDAMSVPRQDVHGVVAVSTSGLAIFPERYGWVQTRGVYIAQAADSFLIYRVP